MGIISKSGAEIVDGLGGGGASGVALALELHADLDKIQRVGGAAGDNGSDASLDKSFDTHFPIESKVESFGVFFPFFWDRLLKNE